MNKPRIVYIYDPLCGWCYGFSPVMRRLETDFHDQVHFSVMSGGLAIGSRAVPVREGYGYIREASGEVTRRTGVPFGEKFVRNILEEGTYVYNSEPPCIALTVCKELQPDRAMEFAHDLQHVFFYEGQPLDEAGTYVGLCAKYGMDAQVFLEKWGQPLYRQRTYQEFQHAQQLGATGFPTVIYADQQRASVLARGFLPYEPLAQNLRSLLSSAE